MPGPLQLRRYLLALLPVAMGLLRKYLVENLGINAARTMLTQFGFAHGWRMASRNNEFYATPDFELGLPPEVLDLPEAMRTSVWLSALAGPMQLVFMITSVFGGAVLGLRQYAAELRPALRHKPH